MKFKHVCLFFCVTNNSPSPWQDVAEMKDRIYCVSVHMPQMKNKAFGFPTFCRQPA